MYIPLFSFRVVFFGRNAREAKRFVFFQTHTRGEREEGRKGRRKRRRERATRNRREVGDEKPPRRESERDNKRDSLQDRGKREREARGF